MDNTYLRELTLQKERIAETNLRFSLRLSRYLCRCEQARRHIEEKRSTTSLAQRQPSQGALSGLHLSARRFHSARNPTKKTIESLKALEKVEECPHSENDNLSELITLSPEPSRNETRNEEEIMKIDSPIEIEVNDSPFSSEQLLTPQPQDPSPNTNIKKDIDYQHKLFDVERSGLAALQIDADIEEMRKNMDNKARRMRTSLAGRQSIEVISPLLRLRRVIKTVSLIIKFITTNVEQTKKNEEVYLAPAGAKSPLQNRENRSNQYSAEDLDFDASYFRARREKKLSLEAVNTLKMHPKLRTPDQIRAALLSMNEAVEPFGEFPLNMQQALIERGWYERYEPKRVIIRQHHAARNFYFMISGRAVVKAARKHPVTGETYEETLTFLKRGKSFGELALMYGGRRAATVSCEEDTELLCVSREDFIDIFMHLDAVTEPSHITFLKEAPLFLGWPIERLPYDDPKICLFTYFRKDTVLCRDSNMSDWIYVVRTGSCRVILAMKAMHDTIPRLKSKSRLVQHGLPLREAVEYQNFVSKAAQSRVVRNANMESAQAFTTLKDLEPDPKKKVYIHLKSLRPRDVFGLETVAFELFGGTTGVTLVSDGAECVLINARFFRKHLSENYITKLRMELQPYPDKETLIAKLREHYNWDAYRNMFINHWKNVTLARHMDSLHF